MSGIMFAWMEMQKEIFELKTANVALQEENENLKTYIRDRLPADHIMALLREVVTGGISARKERKEEP